MHWNFHKCIGCVFIMLHAALFTWQSHIHTCRSTFSVCKQSPPLFKIRGLSSTLRKNDHVGKILHRTAQVWGNNDKNPQKSTSRNQHSSDCSLFVCTFPESGSWFIVFHNLPVDLNLFLILHFLTIFCVHWEDFLHTTCIYSLLKD